MEGVSYHQEVVAPVAASDESFPVTGREGGQGLYFSVCDLDTVCTPGPARTCPGQGGAPGRAPPRRSGLPPAALSDALRGRPEVGMIRGLDMGLEGGRP